MIVKIESLNHQGLGITRVNNKVTFVEQALPGETVDIKVTEEKKKYNLAKIQTIIEKNPNRIDPICPYFNECGGCDFCHVDYETELKFKKEKVENILKRYANINVNVNIVPSDKIYNYRNKITLHENTGIIGLVKKNSNEIIQIKECKLVNEKINELLKNKPKKGIIRTNGKEIISSENENIIINVDKYKFKVNLNSFFQINPYTYTKMFNYIKRLVNENEILLDLYCGVGVFSVLLSDNCKKAYGIEINENSYSNALENKRINNLNNVNFMLGKVEDNLPKIKEKVDTIIVDPPRSGLSKTTINQILNIKPKKIIYISCNPMTLARDLKIMNFNYKIEIIKGFDMFPRTNHVECVCVLIHV